MKVTTRFAAGVAALAMGVTLVPPVSAEELPVDVFIGGAETQGWTSVLAAADGAQERNLATSGKPLQEQVNSIGDGTVKRVFVTSSEDPSAPASTIQSKYPGALLVWAATGTYPAPQNATGVQIDYSQPADNIARQYAAQLGIPMPEATPKAEAPQKQETPKAEESKRQETSKAEEPKKPTPEQSAIPTPAQKAVADSIELVGDGQYKKDDTTVVTKNPEAGIAFTKNPFGENRSTGDLHLYPENETSTAVNGVAEGDKQVFRLATGKTYQLVTDGYTDFANAPRIRVVADNAAPEVTSKFARNTEVKFDVQDTLSVQDFSAKDTGEAGLQGLELRLDGNTVGGDTLVFKDVPLGAHTVEAVARDNVGNETVYTVPVRVVDASKAYDNAGLQDTDNVYIKGSLSAQNSEVLVKPNSEVVFQPTAGYSVADGNTVRVGTADKKVVVTDGQGSDAEVLLKVKNTAPSINAKVGEDTVKSNKMYTVSADGKYNLSISSEDKTNPEPVTTTVRVDNAETAPDTKVGAGIHTVEVESTDVVGNKSTLNYKLNVLDNSDLKNALQDSPNYSKKDSYDTTGEIFYNGKLHDEGNNTLVLSQGYEYDYANGVYTIHPVGVEDPTFVVTPDYDYDKPTAPANLSAETLLQDPKEASKDGNTLNLSNSNKGLKKASQLGIADDQSGLREVYYELDGSKWEPTQLPAGNHKVTVNAVDNVGNTYKSSEFTYNVNSEFQYEARVISLCPAGDKSNPGTYGNNLRAVGGKLYYMPQTGVCTNTDGRPVMQIALTTLVGIWSNHDGNDKAFNSKNVLLDGFQYDGTPGKYTLHVQNTGDGEMSFDMRVGSGNGAFETIKLNSDTLKDRNGNPLNIKGGSWSEVATPSMKATYKVELGANPYRNGTNAYYGNLNAMVSNLKVKVTAAGDTAPTHDVNTSVNGVYVNGKHVAAEITEANTYKLKLTDGKLKATDGSEIDGRNGYKVTGVEVRDVVGNRYNATDADPVRVFVDDTKPEFLETANMVNLLGGAENIRENNGKYYAKKATVASEAAILATIRDTHSGIRQAHIYVDGQQKNYGDVLDANDENGYYTVTLRAIDNVGNVVEKNLGEVHVGESNFKTSTVRGSIVKGRVFAKGETAYYNIAEGMPVVRVTYQDASDAMLGVSAKGADIQSADIKNRVVLLTPHEGETITLTFSSFLSRKRVELDGRNIAAPEGVSNFESVRAFKAPKGGYSARGNATKSYANKYYQSVDKLMADYEVEYVANGSEDALPLNTEATSRRIQVAARSAENADLSGSAAKYASTTQSGNVLYKTVGMPAEAKTVTVTTAYEDVVGNVYDADTVLNEFTIDSTKPSIKVNAITDMLTNGTEHTYAKGNETYIALESAELANDRRSDWAEDSESGVREVKLYIDGNEVDNVENTVKLSEGEHSVVVKVYDNVGNESEKDLGRVFVTDDKATEKNLSGELKTVHGTYSNGSDLYYNAEEGAPRIEGTVSGLLTGVANVTAGNENTTVEGFDPETGNFTVRATGTPEVEVTNLLGVSTKVSLTGANVTGAQGKEGWTRITLPAIMQGGESNAEIHHEGDVKGLGRVFYRTYAALKSGVGITVGLPDGNAPVDINQSKILVQNQNGEYVEVPTKVEGSTLRIDTDSLPSDYHVTRFSAMVRDILGNSKQAVIENNTAYVDDAAPKFSGKIVFNGNAVNSTQKPGKYLTVFNSDGRFLITANDGNEEWQSGVKFIHYTLVSEDSGKVKEDSAAVNENGVVEVPVSDHFRGYLTDVYAEDKVDNRSQEVIDSEGVITEGVSMESDHGIGIDIQDTPHRDENGNRLYNTDVKIGVSSEMKWSGFNNAKLFVNGEQVGNWQREGFSSLVDRVFGVILGNVRAESVYGVEGNNHRIDAEATDNAGHTIKTSTIGGSPAVFSIDKTAPRIEVTWNETSGNNMYAHPRVATVTIHDVNPDRAQSVVEATDGVFSGWARVDGGLRGTVTYDKDTQNAGLRVTATDLAGNVGSEYRSETFIVDQTRPVVTVQGHGNVKNGKYYAENRTFTVTVKDRNFDSSGLKVEGGTVGGFSGGGDTYSATVTTTGDGTHKISVVATDKVGNVSDRYQSEEYVQDTKKPAVDITGVSDGVSYGGDTVEFSGRVSDENLDTRASYGTLTSNTGKNSIIGGKSNSGAKDETYGKVSIESGRDKDGYYRVTVHAEDLAGNTYERTANFTVNRYGAQYAANTDDLGKYLHKTNDIVLTETSYDRLDTSRTKFIITRNGAQLTIPEGAVRIKESGGKDGQPYVYTYTISKDLFQKDGVYRIQVFSYTVNGKGNTSASVDYTFVIDNTAPHVAISGIRSNSNVYSTKNVPVSVIARDDYGIAEGTYSTTQNVSGDLLDGQALTYISSGRNIAVKASVRDKAGNVSDVAVNGVSVYDSPLRRYAVPVAVALAALLAAAVAGVVVANRRKGDDRGSLFGAALK